jgi:MATE family multidrug resistance protein
MFLAQLSVEALAASMPAAMLNWSAMSLPFGIASYTNAFVSQYEGAGRKDRVAAAVWQGLLVSVLGGLCLFPLFFLAPQIFSWMGHAPEVQELEVAYFKALLPVAIPMLISTVLSSYFTARKRTQVVMWVNIGMSLINAILAYLWIFGRGPFPGLGIRGAALSTLAAQYVGVIVMAVLLVREARVHGYPFKAAFGVDWGLIGRIVRYGFPNGIQMVLDVGAFTVFIALVGQLGTTEQAATNLAFTLNSMAFIPMIGMGTAVMTLVGHRVGEGDPGLATQTVWKAFGLSGGYMCVFAAIYLSLPEVILYPSMHGTDRTQFETIRPVVISLLQFVAVYTVFDAMAIVFGSAVRGAGDTLFSLLFTVGIGWLLLVLPTLWLVQHGGGLYGCWIAVTATVIVLGLGLMWRFQGGYWKTLRVIEHDSRQDLPQGIGSEPLA